MKFNNTDWSVSGSKHLLGAFAKDLEEAGWGKVDTNMFPYSPFCNLVGDCDFIPFYNGEIKCNHFTLPEQYNEALEYATEKEEKLEVGKWCTNGGRGLWFAERIEHKEHGSFAWGYGFHSMDGEWTNNQCSNVGCLSKWREATKEEVEKALIAEAKRRGFKKGVEYKPYNCSFTRKVTHELKLTKYYELSQNGFLIFENGKWAEIIEDKVPVITVNATDYKMEVEGGYIKFGCAYFIKDDITEIFNLLTDRDVGFGYNTEKGNRTIKSITLDSGVEITVDKLKEIKEYLDS